MVTAIREETREQTLRRLANKAREHGVRLVRDGRDGRHYASSVSHPGQWHYVTAVSCDCIGFHRHQRCMHHAALLSAYGWIGDEPTPEPEPIRAQQARCESCNGVGAHSGTISTGRGWAYANVTCEHCHGTGQAAAPQAA